MPFMTRIPSDLARFGLAVELVPGWETRGSSSFAPGGVVDHWTAGPRGTTGRPSLAVVTNGRPGLAGPLCNVYLARDGTCVVVAAGRANHAGEGGFRGLVGNSAVYGIEAECGGDGDWTPEMLDAYPRLNAALLSGLGRDASWVCGHNEWAPDRKIDIRDIVAAVRAGTATALTTPDTGDDMYGPNERYEVVSALGEITGNTRSTNGAVAAMAVQLAQVAAHVGAPADPKAIADLLRPMLTEAVQAGMAADNDAQADEIVDRLAARLAS